MESKDGKYTLPSCVGCKKRILGNFIGALGKHWHPEHFNCCVCSKNIVGCFYHSSEEIYCKEHFKESISPKCGCCNQPTMDEPNVVAFGKHWIISHFQCHYLPCKKQIKGTDVFYLHENKPFCCLEHVNEVKKHPQEFYSRVPIEKLAESASNNLSASHNPNLNLKLSSSVGSNSPSVSPRASAHSPAAGSGISSPSTGSSIHSSSGSAIYTPGSGSAIHSPATGSSIYSSGSGSAIHSPAAGSAIQSPASKFPKFAPTSPRSSAMPILQSPKPSTTQLSAPAPTSPRQSSSPGLTSAFPSSPTTSPRNQSNQAATMPTKMSPRGSPIDTVKQTEATKSPRISGMSGSNINLKEEFSVMVSISKKLPETEKQLANLAQNPSKEETERLMLDVEANLVCMTRLKEQFFGPDMHQVTKSKEQLEKLQAAALQITDQLTRQKQQLEQQRSSLLSKESEEATKQKQTTEQQRPPSFRESEDPMKHKQSGEQRPPSLRESEENAKAKLPQRTASTKDSDELKLSSTPRIDEILVDKVSDNETDKFAEDLSPKELLSPNRRTSSANSIDKSSDEATEPAAGEVLLQDTQKAMSFPLLSNIGHRNSKGIEIIKSWENKKKVLKDRSLIVHVLEGRNLPAKDITGTSDPYCKVNLNGQIFQTGVIWKNLNPFWGEEFRFKVTEMDSTTRITFTVKDKDTTSNDDLMGVLDIPLKPLEDQQMREQWWSLMEAEDLNYDISGDLHLQLILDTSSTPNKLNVKVLEARNIAAVSSTGTSDPFVEIKSSHEKPKRTTVVRKTTSPKWQESFVFFLSDLSSPVLFHMYHSSLLANNFLGEVAIAPKDLVHNKLVDNFFMLRHRTKEKKANCGDIRLRLKYVETKIIQLQAYDPLLELIMDPEFTIIKCLGEVTSEKEAVATILTNIFSTKGRLEDLLTHLTQVEINSQVESATLFRGNSLTTKSIDVAMKLVGQKYLEKTIGPHINLIYSVQPDIELDPTKLKPGVNAKKSLQALNELCEKFCNSIFNSIDNCPIQMRTVFHALQQQVTEKFPNEPECRYTAVAGFLFLRFFCAAILGPKLFSIAPEHPAKKTARTLTLIAKVVQNLANLSDFGPKEPHMKQMNPFIAANLTRLKTFVDTVSTLPPGANPGYLQPIFLEKELYLLYHHLVLNKGKLMPVLESHSPEKKNSLERVLDHLNQTYDL